MIQRLYKYVCKCNEPLSTWVTSRDMKAGEKCDRCNRVYDVAFDGTITPMPLPPGAKVTLNGPTVHWVYHPIMVDNDCGQFADSIMATLHQEIV